MKYISQTLAGARCLLHGFSLLNKPGLRRYVAVPLVVNMVLFTALIAVGLSQFDALIQQLLPNWLDWLDWLLWPLFALTLLVVAFYTFTLVANLIAAPFNSQLAAAVERYLGDAPPSGEGGWQRALKDLIPGLWQEMKKFFILAAWALPLLILFLIPGLNVIAPFAWLLLSAWLLAFEYSDYPLGNHGLNFPDQRTLLRQNRFAALGFGGMCLFLTSIPVVNFFVMPAAVAGATVLWRETVAEKQNALSRAATSLNRR
ncbi:MAG TPA: sulfate transporter CysZ [Gammaproteobacteria bacterium]|nr:sulfate transporter CysZ [Gammaproteobacteria bacterium]